MTHIATPLIWIISIASILLMLLRPRHIAEAYWVCGGALALAGSGLISLRAVGHALSEGVQVYLFLIGMMTLAELAREEGVFEWVARVAAHSARGSRSRLFLLIYLSGMAVTALLSNDATAVVLTPAVLAVVRRAGVRPRPYLLACALVSNAAGLILPFSNPANLVVFDRQMPSLPAWLHIFLLPAIVSVSITFVCLHFLSREELRGRIEDRVEDAALSIDGKLTLSGLLLAAAWMISASYAGVSLGPPACGAAVLALLVVSWRHPRTPWKVARGVSWAVVPLVAGLFVIVEALKGAGLQRAGAAAFAWLSHAAQPAARLVAGSAIALFSNVMNNLPVALIGAAAIRSAPGPAQSAHALLAHAILIGVDIGPNLSVTGSLSTILWLIVLRRENVEITPWQFLKTGIVVMPLALLGSLLVLTK